MNNIINYASATIHFFRAGDLKTASRYYRKIFREADRVYGMSMTSEKLIDINGATRIIPDNIIYAVTDYNKRNYYDHMFQ